MKKEKAIDEFFRSLRVTLTNAFSYPKDHPYFLKSIDSFKLKLQEVQETLNPLKIGVTDTGLVVNEESLSGSGFYEELGRLLHQRKIKSVEIRSGVTPSEIVSFFSVISMSTKDILKQGGVNALLGKYQVVNFIVEELDYSVLLQENGQECADLWGYLLNYASQGNDQSKLDSLVENFGGLIKRTDQNDLFKTEAIPSNISDFLLSLKEKNKEHFAKCSKELFLWLLRNKKSLNEEKMEKLKLIFNSLNSEDMDTLFWEGLLQEDNFDILSLELFSKISEQKNPQKFGEGFLSKLKSGQQLAANNPKVVKTVKNLLTGIHGSQLSAVYRHTLESLVRGISASGVQVFDQKALRENYRYITLNVLSVEEDKDNLSLAAEILEKELPVVLEDDALDFLKDLWGALLKRKNEPLGICAELEKKFSAFIENIILNQDLPAEKEFFLEMVSLPSQDAGFYLDKIFAAEKANKNILSLFFKFFPGNLDIFYSQVEQRIMDIEFLASLIEALGSLSTPETLGILDHIYSSANELIKNEILNIMRKLKKVDVQFLLRQLQTESPLLRKNLLSVLIIDAQGAEGALEALFKFPNFLGRKNELLMENMQIAFELGLLEAVGLIHELSRRRFFWNRALRKKAKQVLKEWNAQ